MAFIATLMIITGVESATCSPFVTEMDVTSTAGVQDLVDALDCTGGGIFSVTWLGTVPVEQTIEVTGGSHLTVSQASRASSDVTEIDFDGVAVIDGTNSTGIFHVSDRSMLTLVKLELRGGNSDRGGAVTAISSSSLDVDTNIVTTVDCVFTANSASLAGGAIYSKNSTVNIGGTSVLRSNSAELGGAIFSSASVLNIDGNTTFNSNFKSSGGGAIVAYQSSVVINGITTFTGNSASSFGGAIYAQLSSVAMAGSSSFYGNLALFNGGAVYMDDSMLTASGNVTFAGNSASASGGAIASDDSTALFYGDTAFESNRAEGYYGGAIYSDTSTINIDGTTAFSNNSAKYAGAGTGAYAVARMKPEGAIDSESSVITLDGTTAFAFNSPFDAAVFTGGAINLHRSELDINGDTSFVNNTGTFFGGAINSRWSTVALHDTPTFGNNSADFGGGAMYFQDSTLSIDGSARFTDNSAEDGYGGAIFADATPVNVLGNCSFTNNWAENGGAVYSNASTFTVQGSTSFANNSATSGGAIYSRFQGVYIDGRASFTNNSASLSGGAISTNVSDTHIVGTATFDNNTALLGGAISSRLGSTLTINGSGTFTSNSATIAGGAIYSSAASQIDLRGTSIFSGNEANDGGAISSDEISHVKISGTSTFMANVAGDQGGAVYSFESAVFSISGTTLFSGNTGQTGGGAMFLSSPGTLYVSGATYTRNDASFGGAVALTSSVEKSRTFEGCTFQDNRADNGGALYFYSNAGQEAVYNSVFRENHAELSGGAVVYTGNIMVKDTIFVRNEAGTEGLAILSLGGISDGAFTNVSLIGNVFHCPASQYGYEEPIENPNASCRYELVCARCSAGCDEVPSWVSIEPESTIPVCVDLPEGAVTVSTGTTLATMTLEEGYYRTSADSRDVLECYQKDACVGGKADDESCAAGYEGPYCAVCIDGYAPGTSYSCTECAGAIGRSGTWLAVVMLVVAVMVVLAVVSDLVRIVDERTEEAEDGGRGVWRRGRSSCHRVIVKAFPLTAIKTVVVVWQIVTQFSAIAGDVYPEQYEEFISYLNPINLDIGFILSYSCIAKTSFYDHLLLATIGPLAGLGTMVVTYSIATWRNNHTESTERAILRKHVSVGLFAMFFIYSSVSFTIFQTFVCDKLDDGVTYLRADYSLTCTTAEHSAYKVYSSIMVFVYPVGIPAFFTWWLIRNAHDLKTPERESMPHLEPWGGLWSAYKPARFYFEIVECGRRIVLTGVAVFVLPDSAAQIAIVLLLAVVFLFISESSSPFNDPIEMGLYRWGNGIVLASMYAALLLKVDISNEDTRALSAFVGVLIAANVFMVVTVIVQSCLLVKEYRQSQKLSEVVNPIVRRTPSAALRHAGAAQITGVGNVP